MTTPPTRPPDLRRALALVADTARPAPDPGDDVARAHAASRARRRNRFRAGLAGLAVTSVLGVGVAAAISGPDDRSGPAGQAAPGRAEAGRAVPGAVQLVAQRFDAAPYTFDLTPRGWSVQGQRPQTVTIAPDDGSTSDHPDDFRGKLVIMFDGNPPHGEPVDVDGRRFWVATSEDYTTMATRTLLGEPDGIVRIQYPRDAGWDEPSMLAFLGSVHVGDTARWGLG